MSSEIPSHSYAWMHPTEAPIRSLEQYMDSQAQLLLVFGLKLFFLIDSTSAQGPSLAHLILIWVSLSIGNIPALRVVHDAR